ARLAARLDDDARRAVPDGEPRSGDVLYLARGELDALAQRQLERPPDELRLLQRLADQAASARGGGHLRAAGDQRGGDAHQRAVFGHGGRGHLLDEELAFTIKEDLLHGHLLCLVQTGW